ncbi:WD repeat-containing protein 5-like protein [Bienertia sinuspersici]
MQISLMLMILTVTMKLSLKGEKPLYAVDCNPQDATLVASGGGDNLVWLWRIGREDKANELKGHTDSISCLYFSKDGQLLASGGLDACVKIWDNSGNLKCTFDGPDEGHEFEVGKKQKIICTGSLDATLRIWNPRSGRGNIVKGYWSFSSHSSAIQCIGVSTSMPWVATGGADNKLVIWDLQHSACRSSFEYQDDVSCLLWLGESRYVASACGNGR